MKIAIASDHAGFEYKQKISVWLMTNEHQILDFGCFSEDSVDYPDYGFPAAEAVASGIAQYGILICGTGIGMSITANKVVGIRAACCTTATMAKLARNHNNANVLTLGARIISCELAEKIIDKFLRQEFNGERHLIRIEKIHSISGR